MWPDVKGGGVESRLRTHAANGLLRAEEWDDGGDRLPLRTITDLDCFELTLTAFPAYESTSASLRSDNAAAARGRCEAKMRKRGI
jgi:phage head maturation protease